MNNAGAKKKSRRRIASRCRVTLWIFRSRITPFYGHAIKVIDVYSSRCVILYSRTETYLPHNRSTDQTRTQSLAPSSIGTALSNFLVEGWRYVYGYMYPYKSDFVSEISAYRTRKRREGVMKPYKLCHPYHTLYLCSLPSSPEITSL